MIQVAAGGEARWGFGIGCRGSMRLSKLGAAALLQAEWWDLRLASLLTHLFVCLSVSNFVQNVQADLHEIFREGWKLEDEQIIKFWWRSGSRMRIRIGIATVARRALAEVCAVPVLLVDDELCLRQPTP